MTDLQPESVAVSAGRPHGAGDPVNPAIVLAAPFRNAGDVNGYARNEGNPTVAAFEAAVGALEGGTALAFASGMAAIAAVAEGRPSGGIAVVPSVAYSGTVAIYAEQQRLGRLEVRSVDIADTGAVLAALDGADLRWLETRTNPLLSVPDLPALTAAAKDRGALVGVDATFTPPPLAGLLDRGADLVMHSVTKYLGGHSDVLGGVLVARDDDLVARLRTRRTLTGGIASPFDAYLALRGVRTLSVRLERAQANAQHLAEKLAADPRVARVRYPGLADDPGHERAARQYRGFGAIVSFEPVGGRAAAEAVCDRVELITHGTSLGGVESLIERRARHAGDRASGVPEGLLRLSVGIEHVDDLWADLDAALG
ncbi:MAG: trans-sulfuration enzyme family protein [Jatrophihabitans sp.]|uniref:trans-sulfuration enzyme family protein n=1 Tax=Jatrophihabitans sp. TaxID=1932789 RepID=UPI003F810F51